MKVIVTHFNPDRDGIGAIWLFKKFAPEFKDADVAFAPAGHTLNNIPVDSDEDIVHVDTGGGKFDHHNTTEFTCGAKKVLEYLAQRNEKVKKDKALIRLVNMLVELDHAGELTWPEAGNDRYDLGLDSLIAGWKQLYPGEDNKVVELGCLALESLHKSMQIKVWAEEELKKGIQFDTRFGKAIIIETHNDEVIKMGQRLGYKIVGRKDPKKGYIRIKAYPDNSIDLSKAYKELKKQDPKATWYLHVDKRQLLNGSLKDPDMRPTTLTIEQIIEVVKNV